MITGMIGIVLAATGVVSFKDAGKIKSWDAWDDHLAKAAVTNVLQKEKKCVTWKRLDALDFGLKEVGRLATRTSGEITGSKFSVGCECLDRDYAEWDVYKALLPMLGVKHARFCSGWAKTEQEKDVYDFTWLDRPIRECAAMKIKPWITILYGNPVWGSDFRLGMRVGQLTNNPEAFAAWKRYVKALVTRYADVVDEWEIWNEPFGQNEDYATLFYETAKVVKSVQPHATCICTAVSINDDPKKDAYTCVLERLKRENALDLASYFVYHPYDLRPENSYGWYAEPIRKTVKAYSPKFDVMQGEVGCPAQLEFAHAMAGYEWTEYAQAKWDLRRALGDAVRSIRSNVFTAIDLQYSFMLQSFGLIRSNTLKEFVYRRPSWYAMRNVYSLVDDETVPTEVADDVPYEDLKRADPRQTEKLRLTRATFTRFGRPLHFVWNANDMPTNGLEIDRVTLRMPGGVRNPVCVDMITGRIFEIPAANIRYEGDATVLADIPVWDSPVLIASRGAIPSEKAK